MADSIIEKHPFEPFIPTGAKVMLCGTFPPKPDKWAMDFFYPNFQNDMWRVFGLIFYGEPDRFYDRTAKTVDKAGIQDMLRSFRVGIGETATEVIRTKDNASDKFLEIVQPVNLPQLLQQAPDCTAIVTTGEKAASIIAALTSTEVPAMGQYVDCTINCADGTPRRFRHWRMPSTSRAYPMKLEKKAEYYAAMFHAEGIRP